jgi:hypothetical protein
MKHAAVVLLFGLLVPFQAAVGQAPEVIPVPKGSGVSLWVSAAAAADPDTVIKWNLFGELDEHDSLRGHIGREKERTEHPKSGASGQVAEIPEKDCPSHTVSSSFSQAPDPSTTLPHLIASSTTGIYAGTVTAITPGFYLEAPAELLTVSIDEVLRGPSDHQRPPLQIYLFYGVAHFRIDSYYFCGLSSDGLGDPVVRGRILVFTDALALDTSLFLPSVENQLIFETKTGLRVPAALQRTGAPLKVTTFDTALDIVRQAVAEAKP